MNYEMRESFELALKMFRERRVWYAMPLDNSGIYKTGGFSTRWVLERARDLGYFDKTDTVSVFKEFSDELKNTLWLIAEVTGIVWLVDKINRIK